MNTHFAFRLAAPTVIDVSGVDAAVIVHNVTTNEVKTLSVGDGRETFVTDVRGKTIGHVFLYRQPDHLRLIGPPGQSERIVQHIDRYTIREDATPTLRDADFVALVFPTETLAALGVPMPDGEGPATWTAAIGPIDSVDWFRLRWLGEGTCVALVAATDADSVCDWLSRQSITVGGDAEFQRARTTVGFPWYGIDLDETNLPQEADRDALAISFTKGCYLGQETIARLDALGQVQKKLVRWSISGPVPAAGATLTAADKKVGRLTSITATDDGAIAIGFARRSHFDPGSSATGIDEVSGQSFTGTVVG